LVRGRGLRAPAGVSTHGSRGGFGRATWRQIRQKWRWGAAHIARFDHPMLRFIPYIRDWLGLSAAPGGDGETVARAAFRQSAFTAVHGAGLRSVMDLATPDGAFAVIATGQSGHPFSRHWSDMLPLWQQGRLLPLHAPEGEGGRISLTPPRP